MIISDIISANETNLDDLENEMTQIPKSELNEINVLYDQLNSKLEELIDAYGDDPEDTSDLDDDGDYDD